VFILTFRFALDRLDFLVIDFDDLFFIIYTIIGFVVALRLVNILTIWFGEEVALKTGSALDNQLSPFLRRILLILVSIIAVIVVLGHFNVEVSGLVTTLGIGSLAIALAAQAALSDTISGFVIMFDRPFRIGDRIEIQDLDTWGDVVDIGLRSTRIRTRDNRMVIIPNSVIGKSLVVNYAYPDSQYRIQIEVGVAYGTDLELARKTLVDAVEGVEGVLHERKVEALFLHFGDSALIFRIRWWLESYEDTRRMFDRVNTAIYNALNEASIEMPNPQLDLHHKIDSGDIPQFRKVFRGDK
jgi:small-conductance mechanosensitive channel